VSTLDELVAALGARRAASEWVATWRQRRTGLAISGASAGGALRRVDERELLGAVVHTDTGSGRGSARLSLGPDAQPIVPALDDALERAAGAAGPAWRMTPPAAPARVALADPALEAGAIADVAADVARALGAASAARGVELAAIEAEVVRDVVAVAGSQGLEVRWRATEVAVRAVVTAAGHRRDLAVRARRRADLQLERAVDDARALLELATRVEPTPTGAWPIALRPPALLAGGGHGLLAAIVAQADATAERQGLTRYRAGQPIAAGAAASGNPLTLASDGTLPFAPLSAPLADDGEPVRRFTLVDRGVARSVALDHREAALRRLPPNGGVRNLVVSAGSAAEADLLAPPVLEILDLAWVDLDLRTGDLVAAIGLGIFHDVGHDRPVAGGLVRFDAVAAFALARRSAALVHRGAYVGPDLWRLPAAAVE